MRELVFLDTECTGLDLEADIWEFGAVRRYADGSRSALHMFLAHDGSKAVRLPEPFRSDYAARCPIDAGELVPPSIAARRISEFVGDDAVVIGAVAAFDSQRLAMLFSRRRMHLPCWLYTVVDVCALAAGYLRAHGKSVEFPVQIDKVGQYLGVDPGRYPRHTALGDVAFIEDVYDRMHFAESLSPVLHASCSEPVGAAACA
ncbi:hypothetical protein [Mycobacterium spongiae]|uniref:Exonuclease domain-containing protein n=1 Tax=Mycobacterium spongiae TaxID=886343 RepID=A0A975PX42_9MYCO|nr:hypothetical protein [Mycobacterium spongiae]QUR67707.1 hypothetical protein F6B93_11890 [Mycobacterium spongiae]